MKKLIWTLLPVLALVGKTSYSQVVINELMIKPSSAQDAAIQSLVDTCCPTHGYEWIELYNRHFCDSVDISCFTIASSTSANNSGSFQFPEGTKIGPKDRIVIGGGGVSGADLKLSDLINSLNYCGSAQWSLSDGDGWLALYNELGGVESAVYWTESVQSNPEGYAISNSIFSGKPCSPNLCGNSDLRRFTQLVNNGNTHYAGVVGPATGYSLARVVDGVDQWAYMEKPSLGLCNNGKCVGLVVDSVQIVSDSMCFGDCAGEAIIHYSGGVTPYSVDWYDEGGILVAQGNTLNGACAGTYYVHVKDSSVVTCGTWSFVEFTAREAITWVSTAFVSSCDSAIGSINIIGQGGSGGPYQYKLDSGSFQSSGDFEKLWPNFYDITLKDSKGCETIASIPVNSNVNPSPVTITSTPSKCHGNPDTLVIETTGFVTPVQYSFNGGPFQLGSSKSKYYADPGVLNLIIKDTVNNCPFVKQMWIETPPKMNVSNSIVHATCAGDNGMLDIHAYGGVAPLSFSVNGGGSFGPNASFSNLAGMDYHYVVKDSLGCEFHDTVTVLGNQGPTVRSVGVIEMLCNEDCNGVIKVKAEGIGQLSYFINGVTNDSSGNFYNLCPDSYSIQIEDGDGCTTDTTVTITDALGVNAGMTSDPVSGEPPLEVTFTNSSASALHYEWNLGIPGAKAVSFDTNFTYEFGGVYNVNLIASNSFCYDTALAKINVEVKFPNVFSPNGDGYNDLFHLVIYGTTEYSGNIYNRWGEQVFTFFGPQSRWDGRTFPAGRICPAGTYFYDVKVVNEDGTSTNYKGTVTLLR